MSSWLNVEIIYTTLANIFKLNVQFFSLKKWKMVQNATFCLFFTKFLNFNKLKCLLISLDGCTYLLTNYLTLIKKCLITNVFQCCITQFSPSIFGQRNSSLISVNSVLLTQYQYTVKTLPGIHTN